MLYWLAKRMLMLCLLLTTLTGKAATIEKTLVYMSQRDGLAGETVYRVMTDHNGFKWIATTGGINIYNGRNLMTVRIENERGRSLEILNLCETSDCPVYAATPEGLYKLSTQNPQFKHVLPEIAQPLALLAVGDTLYIGSEQGLHIYDGRQLKHFDIGVSHQGLDNIVRHFQRDEKGLIWFLGRHDLCCFDPHANQISHHDLSSLIGEKPTLTQFCKLGDQFFIGTRNRGLYSVNLAQQEGHHVEGIGKIVLSVSLSDSLVCVGTDGTGAYVLEESGERRVQSGERRVERGESREWVIKEHFAMDAPQGMHRLPTNAVYSFNRDEDGTCWIGMVRCGLAYKPYNSQLFHPFMPDCMSTEDMNVRSFLVNGSQSVIGLQDGLWFIDSERHVCRYFSENELGGHIVNNVVWWNGHYYIGMYDGGIRMLEPSTVSLTPLPANLALLRNTTVGDIKVSPVDSSLWIGCTDGLIIISGERRVESGESRVESGEWQVRQFTEQNSHIIGGIILDITFDREGNAWLTGAKGLSLYSKSTGDIVKTQFPDGFFNKESYMRGLLGHDGTIYMRTGPQLFFTNSQMDRYGEIALPIRLTDKWCRSMADNGHNRLWLASERGLLGIDYEGNGLVQIGEGEGLWGDHLSELHISGDTLWVATNKGLFFTTRGELDQWTVRNGQRVIFYNVRRGSDLLSAEEMSVLSERKEIRLTWNLTSEPLQARPLLLDYACHEGRLYEYKVDGGDWQIVENGHVADVRDLLLGTHLLTVRQAGVKGTETVYKLTVVPSFWAYFELALLVMAIVALWLWWRYRKFTKAVISEHLQTEEALIEELKTLPHPLSAKEGSEYTHNEIINEQANYSPPSQGGGGGESKYQKVKIDETECADIVKRMKEYLEREHVYTNAELKMKDIADVLHLSAPKLSQVFNLYLGENYYDFINRYRLDEFKRLIEAGEYKRFTITALSEQCGFKKSNFFSTFRKVEGMTPAEYLKKHGIRV